jgi:hypothetical protein
VSRETRQGLARLVYALGWVAGCVLFALHAWPALALPAVSCLGAWRWARRWPLAAAWLFRRELDRTRHVDGRALFAYPLAAPVQRRRRVRAEPRMREAGHDGRS